ncbi:hypothetical protein KSP39_PZI011288 [Platanthera zijinensis]|uniref:Uncharacterized protein n=1 Tax=Platanthera zijinensis TaxID=2320716 RepID=A0AAP0G5F6_9ASPA
MAKKTRLGENNTFGRKFHVDQGATAPISRAELEKPVIKERLGYWKWHLLEEARSPQVDTRQVQANLVPRPAFWLRRGSFFKASGYVVGPPRWSTWGVLIDSFLSLSR